MYSSAFTVTCAPSHKFLKIREKMDIFIEMRRVFLQADEGCLFNGKRCKNQDCKINLAQRYGSRGQGPGIRK